MPFGTDPLAATEVARRAAAITGGVVIPTLYCGTERERSTQLLEDAGFPIRGFILKEWMYLKIQWQVFTRRKRYLV